MVTRRQFIHRSVLGTGGLLAASAAAPRPSRAAGQAVVSFWSGTDPTVKKVLEEELLPRFHKENPDIKVEATLLQWMEFFQKVSVAFTGGTGPDVVGSGYGQLGSMIGNKWVQPIDDILKSWSDLGDIQPVGLDSGKKDGKRYAVLLPDLRPFNYRKDYYKEAGLDPEKPPKNWDELREYSRRLTKREGSRVTRAGLDIPVKNGEQFYASVAFTRGLMNLWDEGGMPLFDSPEGVETMEYLLKLMREDKVTVPSDQQAAAGSAFQTGAAAQGFLGTFAGLSARAKHVEAAGKLIRFLFSPDSMWAMYKAAGFQPMMRKSLADRFAKEKPYNSVVTTTLENAVGWPIFPTFLQARQIIITQLEAIYLGQKSARDGLRHAAEETKKIAS
jgi:multiple sugar transport system substrate-binding protein